MKETLKFAKSLLLEDISELKYFVKKIVDVLPMLIQVLAPMFCVYYKVGIGEAFGVAVIAYVVSAYLKKVSVIVNSTTYTGLPIPRIRFTIRDRDNDMIMIRRGMEEEAVLYLYSLEEKLTKRGLLHHSRRERKL